jgi:hypothetical protein
VNAPWPDRPEPRISDADRERAVQRLSEAVTEGRLTVAEFDERVAAVLAARTAAELTPHLADLPGPAGTTVVPEHADLRTTMSTLRRAGRWVVPRRLSVNNKVGTVVLDFTSAVISHPVVDVRLEASAGKTVMILPKGASVDVSPIEARMIASTVKVRKVAAATEPVGDPHVTVTGALRASTLVVRHQRRFLHWRW